MSDDQREVIACTYPKPWDDGLVHAAKLTMHGDQVERYNAVCRVLIIYTGFKMLKDEVVTCLLCLRHI